MLESWKSADKSAMLSAIKGRDHVQGKLSTALAKLGFASGAFTATFDHLKRDFNDVWAAEGAVKERMRCHFGNCIQTIFDKVKKSTEGY